LAVREKEGEEGARTAGEFSLFGWVAHDAGVLGSGLPFRPGMRLEGVGLNGVDGLCKEDVGFD